MTNNRRKTVGVVILILVMTFMEMSALPAALFCNIKIKDIDPIYITLMLNFIIAFAICWLCKKFFIKDWWFGLQMKELFPGLRKYGLPAIIATIIATIAFCIGLAPFDDKPTIWRVVIEGIVYYIGVGIMEELYLRGLLQNIIEKWFGERKNASLYAILIASALFGLGHIWGALGQPIATVICKTVWATALGIYFGAVYVKTKNLWVPIVLHLIIKLSIPQATIKGYVVPRSSQMVLNIFSGKTCGYLLTQLGFFLKICSMVVISSASIAYTSFLA